MSLAEPRHWPFTPAELQAIRDAYEALTRVGNLTRSRDPAFAATDGWHSALDTAHHGLGLVMLLRDADVSEHPLREGEHGW